MAVAKWRCLLGGWDVRDFVDPGGGYSMAAPAEEIVFKDAVTERTILYHHVRSYPAERRYIVVAGYRRTDSHDYTDGEGKMVADIDAVPEGDRATVRAMFTDIASGQDVYFYGE